MQVIINGIASLDGILDSAGCRKILMVTDSSFPFLNIKETILNTAVERVIFDDFSPNPMYEDVQKGIELFCKEGCDSILAIGGGSSIDVAKCIKLAVLAKQGCESLIPPLVKEQIEIDGARIPFIAIPTTAGTGSESTHNAVMYYKGDKQTVTNEGILPHYAILDSTVLATLPLYQKRCTMMDALCQGIESWWSVNSTVESHEYSKKAIELISLHWHKYIFEADSYAASQIMLAANYAGRAINISATTAAHAMSYKITSLYNMPHGHAVAVCLPEVWDYMIQHPNGCVDSRGVEYMTDVFNKIAHSMGVESAKEAVVLFRNMMTELQLENPVADNRMEELTVLASSVNPIRLKNNPVELNSQILRALYDRIVR